MPQLSSISHRLHSLRLSEAFPTTPAPNWRRTARSAIELPTVYGLNLEGECHSVNDSSHRETYTGRPPFRGASPARKRRFSHAPCTPSRSIHKRSSRTSPSQVDSE